MARRRRTDTARLKGGEQAPTRTAHGERSARLIMGVPARIMMPRLVFLVTALALLAFGLLMVYSSSSITALSSAALGNDPTYYLKRQALFAGLGILGAAAIVAFGYHRLLGRLMRPLWGVTILLLAFVLLPFAGRDAYGATRWISLGPFSLQPSEFAKITVILVAVRLFDRFYVARDIDQRTFLRGVALGIAVPLVLIICQPDKGTVMVIALSLVVMAYIAGFPVRYLLLFLAVGIVVFLALSLKDDYSRARLMAMLDPWSDPYNNGYQLIQGFYAFGAGGLFGVGIGMSKQKYNYLPFAHNDFIFAVIGEECGVVGTVGMLAGFAVLLWAGYRIAINAPDLAGRLVAMGCSSILVIQMLLNVCGVIGIFPLSGKPIPFVSYGGSSIMSSIMIVGLVFSVSKESRMPLSEYDERRSAWSVTAAQGTPLGPTEGAGAPMPRSGRPVGRTGFRMYGGGEVASRVRPTKPANVCLGNARAPRIDLGPDAGDRLRGDDSKPHVRGTRGGKGS